MDKLEEKTGRSAKYRIERKISLRKHEIANEDGNLSQTLKDKESVKQEDPLFDNSLVEFEF